jgi:hypothetical protein
MFKEPDEPSIFDEIQTVVFASHDKIGKVFSNPAPVLDL